VGHPDRDISIRTILKEVKLKTPSSLAIGVTFR